MLSHHPLPYSFDTVNSLNPSVSALPVLMIGSSCLLRSHILNFNRGSDQLISKAFLGLTCNHHMFNLDSTMEKPPLFSVQRR